MSTKNHLWNLFSRVVSWGMMTVPKLTVWAAEEAFYVAPKTLRQWVNRYTSEHLLACVVGGDVPFIPDLAGGDAVLFYPLPQCVRYELEEYPSVAPVALFQGTMLALIVPQNKRHKRYHLYGYDELGNRYDGGSLVSHAVQQPTRVADQRPQVKADWIQWKPTSKNYLTSFVLVYDVNKVLHAAGYSRRCFWNYPQTKYLPHVVLPPDGYALDGAGAAVMVLIVDTDAWVPTILIWERE